MACISPHFTLKMLAELAASNIGMQTTATGVGHSSTGVMLTYYRGSFRTGCKIVSPCCSNMGTELSDFRMLRQLSAVAESLTPSSL